MLGLTAVVVPAAARQQPADTRSRFEVVSIRPCPDTGGRRGAGFTPGRLELTCQTIETLIREAYVVFAGGGAANPAGYDVPLVDAPGWVRSNGYLVAAVAQGEPARTVMRGPMLQTLLEDRLKLRIRRETRERPVYALTAAARPLRFSRVDESKCVARDTSRSPVRGAVDPDTQKPFCQTIIRGAGSITGSMTIQELADALGSYVDRPVINQTGLPGIFDIAVRFAADRRDPRVPADGPAADPNGAVSIFTAVQEQLGLRLEPSRGLATVLVVEHIEPPSPN